MSIANLWNHRAVLYRPAAGGVDANGDPTSGIAPGTTPSGLNSRPDQSWSGLLADSPLGETQASMRIWYLDSGFTDVEERDVLDIVSGPESPRRYRIHSVTKPAGPMNTHHVEVATRVYTGDIT